jgi:hypothetical protein
MAGGGVGEAMLIGAAVGATAGGAGAAIQGGDPMKGALMGGAMGAVGGGLGGAAGGVGGTAASGAGAAGGASTGAATGATAGTAAGTTAGTAAGTTAGTAAGTTIGTASNIGTGISGISAGGGTLGSAGFAAPTTSGIMQAGAPVTIVQPGASAGITGAGGAGATAPVTNVFGQAAGTPGYLSNTALGVTAGTAGLAGAMQAERDQYGLPPDEEYDGPLSKIKYDPDKFKASNPTYAPTSVYRPTYAAEGGIMKLAEGGMAVAGNYGYPMNKNPDTMPNLEVAYGMAKGGIARYAPGGMIDPSMGIAAAQQGNQQSYGEGIDTLMGNKKKRFTKEELDSSMLQGLTPAAYESIYGESAKSEQRMATPNQNYAKGGHLGGYSDGGRMLKGPGDGMSDNIPATIAGKQPARLADGEFVIPADVVSHLGNGSTDAGAKQLYAMMNRVRKARTGNSKQGKQIKPAKHMVA